MASGFKDTVALLQLWVAVDAGCAIEPVAAYDGDEQLNRGTSR
jgi:hypothetical protein